MLPTRVARIVSVVMFWRQENAESSDPVWVSNLASLATASWIAGGRNGIPYLAPRLIGCARPDDVALVPRFAEALKDAIVRRNAEHKVARREDPGFGEHDGILDGGFQRNDIALTRIALDDMLLVTVERIAGACSTKPGRWISEQVEVKAPGTPNSTTRRPWQSSAVLI